MKKADVFQCVRDPRFSQAVTCWACAHQSVKERKKGKNAVSILLNVFSRLIWFTATEVVFGGLEYIEVPQFSFRPTNHTAACAKPLTCKCCTSAVNLLQDEKTTVQSSQLVWTNIHNHKKKTKTLTTNRITLWNMSNNCTNIRTWWCDFLCHFERWETSNEVTHHNQTSTKKKKNWEEKVRSATKLEVERSFFFFSSWRSNQGNKGAGHQENKKNKQL